MIVERVRLGSFCKLCKRELLAELDTRVPGRVKAHLTCPKHGTLAPGERYYQGYTTYEDAINEET